MDTDSTAESKNSQDPAKNPPGAKNQGIPSDLLDWRLFSIVSAILILLAVLFVIGIRLQNKSYQEGITATVEEKLIDHAAMLAYDRALGAAIIKTSALFLGYLLVFTGVLFVLRSSEVTYNLAVEAKDYKGALQTTSPGLVIITLGDVLIAIAVLTKSTIDYNAPPSVSMPVQNSTQQGDVRQVDSDSLPMTTAPADGKE
jgi:cytochrome c biogenesis factor